MKMSELARQNRRETAEVEVVEVEVEVEGDVEARLPNPEFRDRQFGQRKGGRWHPRVVISHNLGMVCSTTWPPICAITVSAASCSASVRILQGTSMIYSSIYVN